MSLKIQKINKYRTKNGTDRYVYEVSGSKAELKQYEEVQGAYYKTDDVTGKPLFFTSKFVGNNALLELRTNEDDEKYYTGVPSELTELRMQLMREEMQAESTVARRVRANANITDEGDDDEEDVDLD